jgi:hypothetical protein
MCGTYCETPSSDCLVILNYNISPSLEPYWRKKNFVTRSLYCRPVKGASGGLCGLASLYQALENTILTASQLLQYSYLSMRAALAAEMGTNSTQAAALSDSALLDQFYACEYYFSIMFDCHQIILIFNDFYLLNYSIQNVIYSTLTSKAADLF